MQNQFRDSFLSDTKKNPKDCMEITLRSDRGLQKIKEYEENEMIEEKEETEKKVSRTVQR